jgi:hypothetical protein
MRGLARLWISGFCRPVGTLQLRYSEPEVLSVRSLAEYCLELLRYGKKSLIVTAEESGKKWWPSTLLLPGFRNNFRKGRFCVILLFPSETSNWTPHRLLILFSNVRNDQREEDFKLIEGSFVAFPNKQYVIKQWL